MNDRANEERRTARFLAGASHRIVLGIVLGVAIGAVVGLVVGLVWLPGNAGAVATASLGGVIVGAPLGAFWAGMSRLESPQPGLEPSQVGDPMRQEELTTEERTSPSGEDQGGER